MDIHRDVERDRKETDEKLRDERQRTDSLLADEPVRRTDEVLEQARDDAEHRLRKVREDVDAHLDRQAEILPKITETLEEVAESLTAAAGSLTGVADTLKGAAADPAAADTDTAVTTLGEAAHAVAGAASQMAGDRAPRRDGRPVETAAADSPAELVEKLAEIAGGVAEIAADLDAERQAADHKLRKERELTDHILGEQIEHTESVLVADLGAERGTLEHEREATDRELEKERRHTDESMDHVLAVLAHEQDAHGAVQREFASCNDFLAVVSHDLRGPLGSISLASAMIAQLARDDGRPRGGLEITAVAERIQRSVSVMERLINDLLDLASVEDGKLRVAAERHDARTLVERAVDLLRPLADAKALSLDLALPPTPVEAVFDPDRMLQVVSNVLQNAIKFTPKGGVVRVAAKQSGRHTLLSITDTGIGISDVELPKIFERFRQLDGNRDGLGLGLYISKWIVEAHGGRIWAESTRGTGSTFYITLPAEA
jgi:signal transduction histidine kinase